MPLRANVKYLIKKTRRDSRREGKTTGKRLSDENYSNKLINADDGTKNALNGNVGNSFSLINLINLLREKRENHCTGYAQAEIQ